MRRVTREDRWGKLTNKQVTRWVGSRQIDMRAHGTQKTKTKAMCSHKTKTQVHGQQTNNQPCAGCKTHKPRVHTRHDNMKARSQWNTQAACHTAQDITWMHAADKNTNCVQHNKTHMDRRACGRANSRPHTHTKRQNVERECPNPDTKPKLKTWVPGSEHHAPTWNKARRWESTWLEHTRSRVLTWKQDVTGVSGLCHKTMNKTRPKWQNPDRRKPTRTTRIRKHYYKLTIVNQAKVRR